MSAGGTRLRRWAVAVVGVAAGILPPARGAWAKAMRREIDFIGPDAAALRWAFGCLFASVNERIRSAIMEAPMTRRERINRITGIAPVVMSLSAFAIILVVVTTGWQRNLTDEGAAAHTFQLLIVLQLPLIATFLGTADWGRFMRVARPMVFQFAALGVAFGALAYFQL